MLIIKSFFSFYKKMEVLRDKNMEIRIKLKKLRKLKQFTQQSLAQKSQLNERLIRSYEDGTRNPKDKNLQKLAQALDVDIWTLRDIDIDADNSESIAQLFFQLEEKGLFNNDLITISRDDDRGDGKEQCYLTYPIDRATALLIKQWKLIDSMSIDTKEEGHITYDDWKYDKEKRKLANEVMQKIIEQDPIFKQDKN